MLIVKQQRGFKVKNNLDTEKLLSGDVVVFHSWSSFEDIHTHINKNMGIRFDECWDELEYKTGVKFTMMFQKIEEKEFNIIVTATGKDVCKIWTTTTNERILSLFIKEGVK